MQDIDAKSYLIRAILDQAMLEDIALDTLEQRMLAYPESAETPAEQAELNAAFKLKHDVDEYEHKIAGLIRRLLSRFEAGYTLELAQWKQAVRALDGQDHYLLAMIDLAKTGSNSRPRFGSTNWILIGAAVLLALLVILSFVGLARN